MTRSLFTVVAVALAAASFSLGACQTDKKQAQAEKAQLVPARTATAEKNHVVIKASTPACEVTAPCSLELAVTAGGDTHFNKEYPSRFTPEKAAVQYGEPSEVDVPDEQHARWTVPFEMQSPDAEVKGEVAVSVCNDAECFIEKVPVTLAATGPGDVPAAEQRAE